MNPEIARYCQECNEYHSLDITPSLTELTCPHCQTKWGTITNPDDIFDYCPICQCRQFYLSKDFNQFLGCLVMLIGIVLVPFSYGLSLPVFALIDWLLHRRVPYIINCYRCGCEFRHFQTSRKFKPFLHHIGLKYDKYR
ncbi:MAG: hypothetical protein H6755_06840 [Candidatus Omnitrophica bacterium]|nr:hypothetical protein [Candidatus Omnitrophota bacterium]